MDLKLALPILQQIADDPTLPWQYQYAWPDGAWRDTEDSDPTTLFALLANGYPIRIKPFELPPCPHPAGWHEGTEEWQHGDLPEGWRPLLKGEPRTVELTTLTEIWGCKSTLKPEWMPADPDYIYWNANARYRTNAPLPHVEPERIPQQSTFSQEELKAIAFFLPGGGFSGDSVTFTAEFINRIHEHISDLLEP